MAKETEVSNAEKVQKGTKKPVAKNPPAVRDRSADPPS